MKKFVSNNPEESKKFAQKFCQRSFDGANVKAKP